MKKKLINAILALTWLCTGIISVGSLTTIQAAAYTIEDGTVDFGKGDASITIQGNEGQSLVGKEFIVYKLFGAKNSVDGSSIDYTFNEEYKTALQNVVGAEMSKLPSEVTEYEVINYIQSLNSNVVGGAHAEQSLEGSYSDFRYFIERLRNEMDNLNCTGDVVTVNTVNSFNNIKIDGLEYGYYIVDERTDNSGKNAASSLCMVDTANPAAAINIKSDYPEFAKKILEDDNQEEIGADGWNDIADYEIGQKVPYKYSSDIPNINGYDTYYYAWHDIMDEALTFNKDSIKIIISDGAKEYEVAASEFSVTENPDTDTTFKVVITDIKAIVDREFNNIDNWSHNAYGQTVTLFYDATLNENAAGDTGRPGFENNARLEFSNNPEGDETGFTPWDTVVVFTYKLNVLKTNDRDVALEDARFRLYADEACKSEVYVKNSDKGYVVSDKNAAEEMISDENGNVVICGLDGGVYYLKEVKALDGYSKILAPIKLTIQPTYIGDRNNYLKGDGATEKTLVSLDVSAQIKQLVSEKYEETTKHLETNTEEGAGNLTVINHVGRKLPVTGSAGTIALVAIGSITMLTGLKISARKKHK